MRDQDSMIGFICSNKKKAIETGAAFILTFFIISLMGWTLLDWPAPAKTPTLVDKRSLVIHTTKSLAEHTAVVNDSMVKQSRGGR